MAAVEEHKPAEKRRALGRGLDSLLPSGPRVVSSTPTPVVTHGANPHASPMVPPIVIPTQGSSAVAAPAPPEVGPELVPPASSSPVPAEIADLHAATHVSQKRRDPSANSGQAMGHPSPEGDLIQQIPLDQIDENPYQTRRTFDEAALNELAESIKASGLAQPVVVRPGANGRYVLVLGERRCRASKLAGKTAVPAIVRSLGNEQAAEMTIVENLQRQDLNCLEQAQAFARLSREFNLTQEQIGKRTGASRESVANYMRLLKLPNAVLDLVGKGKIGFSEARVLLEAASLVDEAEVVKLAREAVERNLTVKELQGRLHFFKTFGQPDPPREPKPVDPNVKDAERRLREALGMRVRVMAYQGNKGQVVIRYESLADFDRVMERLSRDE
jgi:ParB family transcriptional regulator, chromosome partitioning protein